MKNYSISDLENLTGIKAHTIRIWEKRYNLLTPKRTKTNIRYYTSADLTYLLNIALLVNNGHKISKAAKYSQEDVVFYVKKINSHVFTANHILTRLMKAIVVLDELAVNKVLNDYIENQSLEKCVNEIMLPFMHRIGIMWQLNETSPVEEHFVSNLFRQKIIGAIDRLPLKNSLPKCILFLPENEWHELGLLYAYYLLRKKGYHVYYLGPSTPLESLIKSIEMVSPKFMVSAFSINVSHEHAQKYLNTIDSNCNIYLGGQFFNRNNIKLTDNCVVLNSPKALLEALEN